MGLFSKVFKVVGSLVNRSDKKKAAKKAREQQDQINQQNYEAQKEFAQNGLQWKANDARLAGVHPVAALGAGGAAFSPSFSVGSGSEPFVDNSSLFDALDALVDSGQNTARAQRATLSDHDREMQAAVLRNQQLQNALLEGQLAATWANVLGQPSNPPGPGPTASMPVNANGAVAPGQVKLVPSESESQRPGQAGLAAGRSPLFRQQDISQNTSWELLNPDAGETFEAYGELAKPFMAAAAHFRRWWDQPGSKLRRHFVPKSLDKRRFRGSGASGSW